MTATPYLAERLVIATWPIFPDQRFTVRQLVHAAEDGGARTQALREALSYVSPPQDSGGTWSVWRLGRALAQLAERRLLDTSAEGAGFFLTLRRVGVEHNAQVWRVLREPVRADAPEDLLPDYEAVA